MTTDASSLARVDRGTLRAVAWLAAIAFTIGLAGIAIGAVTSFAAPTLSFDDLSLANGGRPAFTDSVDAITAAHYSAATLEVEGPPSHIRWLIAASGAVGALPGVAIAALTFFLGRRIAAGSELLPRAAIGSGIAAVVAFAAALFAPFLRGLAEAELVRWLDLARPGAESPWVLLFAIRADAIALPTVLLVLSAVLFIASRLQRETRGLV